AIAFSIRDQDSNTLLEQPRCELANLFGDLSARSAGHVNDLIDFHSALPQISGAWPMSDVDNPLRTFRYALTHLAVGSDGRCSVRSDVDGFLDIPNSVTKLAVDVSLWDSKENHFEKSFGVDRVPNSQEFTVGGSITGLVGEVTLKTNGKKLV